MARDRSGSGHRRRNQVRAPLEALTTFEIAVATQDGGDNEVVQYLVDHGANVMAVNRAGQTTVDMANSPEQRTQPFPATIALLEKMGAKNNNNCRACK